MTIPVYLFTGFLESGKTTVIKETLLDPDFTAGEKTLLLLCEDGVETYDDMFLEKTNSALVSVSSECDLHPAFLKTCGRLIEPNRVLIEFNGMWNLHTFLNIELPSDWLFVQTISIVNAFTFEVFLKNMRSFMYEQLYFSDNIIFNRCDENTDKRYLRNNVKAINRSAQLIYETLKGEIIELGKDELPFDVHADCITIADDDYGLWYMDAFDNPATYEGKTICVQGKVIENSVQGVANAFVFGRYAMVCCGDDVSLIGFICHHANADILHQGDWIRIVAQIIVEYDSKYQRDAVTLYVTEIETIEAIEHELVYFT